MLRVNKILENTKKINLCKKHREKYLELKAAQKLARKTKDYSKILKLMMELARMPKNSSKVRQVNRCMKTGRTRGLVLYKLFGMSGCAMRNDINKGYVPGVVKI